MPLLRVHQSAWLPCPCGRTFELRFSVRSSGARSGSRACCYASPARPRETISRFNYSDQTFMLSVYVPCDAKSCQGSDNLPHDRSFHMSYTLNLHTFGRSHVVATRGFSKLKLPSAGFFRLTPRELVRVKPDSFMILDACEPPRSIHCRTPWARSCCLLAGSSVAIDNFGFVQVHFPIPLVVLAVISHKQPVGSCADAAIPDSLYTTHSCNHMEWCIASYRSQMQVSQRHCLINLVRLVRMEIP